MVEVGRNGALNWLPAPYEGRGDSGELSWVVVGLVGCDWESGPVQDQPWVRLGAFEVKHIGQHGFQGGVK